nr:MAG TPA: hypothetical protein [Caudoviricetes sp.]
MCYHQIVAAYFLHAKRLLRWRRTDYWTVFMIWYINLRLPNRMGI